MSNPKQFDLATVLSVTTGRLLCDMDNVYAILNHITGDNLFTHALPRASRFASPLILAKYPELDAAGSPEQLAKLDELLADARAHKEPPMVACSMWVSWLKEPGTLGLKSEYQIENHASAWLQIDPISEPVSMVGKEKVIVV